MKAKIILPKKPLKPLRGPESVTQHWKMGRILAATDFSPEARVGLLYAEFLSVKLQSNLTLLHVVELPSPLSGIEASPLVQENLDFAELARKQLRKTFSMMKKGDISSSCCIRIGKAFHEIVTAARDKKADLIVLATHGYTGPKRVLLGSTAERVVRHAHCSVLTVPTSYMLKRSRPALQTILVPVDFSALSRNALQAVINLAEEFGSNIVLLHVVEKFPIDYFLGRELTESTIAPLIKAAQAELEHLSSDLSKSTPAQISVHVRSGIPHEEICLMARSVGADLIALGTHGYTGLKHVWLGSTAERVVRNARVPVLVARES